MLKPSDEREYTEMSQNCASFSCLREKERERTRTNIKSVIVSCEKINGKLSEFNSGKEMFNEGLLSAGKIKVLYKKIRLFTVKVVAFTIQIRVFNEK